MTAANTFGRSETQRRGGPFSTAPRMRHRPRQPAADRRKAGDGSWWIARDRSLGANMFPRGVVELTATAPEGRQYSCRISGGCSVVLVDEAAEAVAAADLTHCRSSFVPGFGRLEFECTVRVGCIYSIFL